MNIFITVSWLGQVWQLKYEHDDSQHTVFWDIPETVQHCTTLQTTDIKITFVELHVTRDKLRKNHLCALRGWKYETAGGMLR